RRLLLLPGAAVEGRDRAAEAHRRAPRLARALAPDPVLLLRRPLRALRPARAPHVRPGVERRPCLPTRRRPRVARPRAHHRQAAHQHSAALSHRPRPAARGVLWPRRATHPLASAGAAVLVATA